MLANRLKKGESATIIKVNAQKELRGRFNSFGIVPGEEITVKEHSLAKQTIEISIGTTLVVLRREEAEKIEVNRDEEKR
ncbi:MAG: FeoA family protein [Campylobacterota bacterium]|nr:FeoA family protein [Campylobacterota bacterium]